MGSGRARPGCWWAAAKPGRASRRRAQPPISHHAPLLWRAPEGPEGTGGLRDRPLRAKLACGDLAGGRTRRRPQHQRHHKQTRGSPTGAKDQAGVLVGGVRAWPGFETTRPATDQPPCATVVEGAGGSGGHGRASRSTTPSRRLACGDLAGGRTRRHPQHQRRHKQHAQEGRRPPAHTAVQLAEQNARQPVRAAARSRN